MKFSSLVVVAFATIAAVAFPGTQAVCIVEDWGIFAPGTGNGTDTVSCGEGQCVEAKINGKDCNVERTEYYSCYPITIALTGDSKVTCSGFNSCYSNVTDIQVGCNGTVECSGEGSCGGANFFVPPEALTCSGDSWCSGTPFQDIEDDPTGNLCGDSSCSNATPDGKCPKKGSDEYCEAKFPGSISKDGGCSGDPHFKTFSGHLYDFHGECDLVLLQSKKFDDGLGLDVHVRTEIRNNWSYIAATAVKIGQETLEVGGFGRYRLNGVKDVKLTALAGVPIKYQRGGKKQAKIEIDMGSKGKISVKAYHEFLAVSVSEAKAEDFDNAVGLMGDFQTGSMIGRDGKTVYEKDPNSFGLEWQVNEMDPILFQEAKGPRFPALCKMPPPISEQRRRLESTISFEDAAKACANWPEAERANCISDVQMTGELGLADAMAF